MDKQFINTILDYRTELIVPLKYVDKEEALNKNLILKDGYINDCRKDGSDTSEMHCATIDVDEFLKAQYENDLIIKLTNMKNIKTIKNCVVFFTVLTVISIIAIIAFGINLSNVLNNFI